MPRTSGKYLLHIKIVLLSQIYDKHSNSEIPYIKVQAPKRPWAGSHPRHLSGFPKPDKGSDGKGSLLSVSDAPEGQAKEPFTGSCVFQSFSQRS